MSLLLWALWWCFGHSGERDVEKATQCYLRSNISSSKSCGNRWSWWLGWYLLLGYYSLQVNYTQISVFALCVDKVTRIAIFRFGSGTSQISGGILQTVSNEYNTVMVWNQKNGVFSNLRWNTWWGMEYAIGKPNKGNLALGCHWINSWRYFAESPVKCNPLRGCTSRFPWIKITGKSN